MLKTRKDASEMYDAIIDGCGNAKGRVKYQGRLGWVVFGLPMTHSFGVVFDDDKRTSETIKAIDLELVR